MIFQNSALISNQKKKKNNQSDQKFSSKFQLFLTNKLEISLSLSLSLSLGNENFHFIFLMNSSSLSSKTHILSLEKSLLTLKLSLRQNSLSLWKSYRKGEKRGGKGGPGHRRRRRWEEIPREKRKRCLRRHSHRAQYTLSESGSPIRSNSPSSPYPFNSFRWK